MTKDSIIEKIGEILKEEITEDDNLKEDLRLDSLDQIDLMMSLEKEFNISMDDTEFSKCETVKDIVDLINK